MNHAPVVLVTGGARRIGAEICRHFHAAGYRVLVHYSRSRVDAEHLADELNRSRTDSAVPVCADLSETEKLGEFTHQCIDVFSRIDVLVNNASIFEPSRLEELDRQSLLSHLEVNFLAPALLCRSLASQVSSIISISDRHAVKPLSDYLAYSASKAALDMLTRSLALELAPQVRVNGIAPGAILWPESAAEMDEEAQRQLLETIPMGRLGTPADIAALAVYLATKGTYISGETISVAGGDNRS